MSADGEVEARLDAARGLAAAGKFAKARQELEEAVALNPDFAAAQQLLGDICRVLGDAQAASMAYQAALANDPANMDVRNNLGVTLFDLGRLDEARRHFEAVSRAEPENPGVLGNLGNVLRDLGLWREAEACFDRALALAPNDPKVLSNKALALQHAGDAAAAVALFRRALEFETASEPLHSNLAQALLQAGEFTEGWREFEWRLTEPAIAAGFAAIQAPRWDGAEVAGKTLLLCAEQGLGDAIQFVRYVPVLAKLGARVILACTPGMARLLGGVGGVAAIHGGGAPWPEADCWAPLMSLPHLLGTDLGSVPADTPYLTPDPGLTDLWAPRLNEVAADRLKVGLAWQGHPGYLWDRARSMPLASLAPVSEIAGAAFFALQKGVGHDQLAAAGAGSIVDLGADLDLADAFTDTAAVMASLDLIITSDTAIPHLAGALARPVWMLLPHAADWRWLVGRDDSPWYPTMRIFRQKTPGDWQGLVAEVKDRLGAWIAAGGKVL